MKLTNHEKQFLWYMLLQGAKFLIAVSIGIVIGLLIYVKLL
jgi:hypothetical protein